MPHFNTAKFIKLTIFHGWFTLGKLILFPSFHFWFPSLRYWTQFPLTVGYWIWDPLNCTKWNKKKLCGDTLATLSTHVLNKFLKSSWKLWFLGTNAFARVFLHTFIALLRYNIPFSLFSRKLSLDGSLVATM